MRRAWDLAASLFASTETIEQTNAGSIPRLLGDNTSADGAGRSGYDRRSLLSLGIATLAGGIAMKLLPGDSAWAAATVNCNPNRPATPAAALAALKAGNNLWAAGKQHHPGEDAERRSCLAANGQSPFAAILSCSDSRVPPSLVFDHGLGDLFVVRVAGNSNVAIVQESLAYGVDNLGAPVLMVLGHQDCGAVKAAVASYPHPGPTFVEVIYPAVRKAREIVEREHRDPNDPALVTPIAITQHVIQTAAQLGEREPFRKLVEDKKLQIAGGVYSLDKQTVAMVTA